MKYLYLAAAAALFGLLPRNMCAQELMVNGDFETLEVEGEPPTPVLDAHGNVVPINWFRSTNSPPAIPLTELIGPANGDPPTDSDGNGEYAAALNVDPTFANHSDWRSSTFATTPGEEVFWSFDFMVSTYQFDPSINASGSPEGFRIELRSFNGEDTSGFVGEETVYVYIHGFGEDTTGDGVGDSGGFAAGGSWPHAPESVTVMNFPVGSWQTLSSDLFGDIDDGDDNNLWRIPDGGNFSDMRVSINAFNFILTDEFQLLVDNMSVIRPSDIVPTGDYNGDGIVDAADYTVWRDTLGQLVANPGEGADGDLSGEIDQGDYAFWKSHFGDVVTLGAGATTASTVPEPTAWIFSLITVLSLFGSGRSLRDWRK